jgi:hypothetical protein
VDVNIAWCILFGFTRGVIIDILGGQWLVSVYVLVWHMKVWVWLS